MRRRHRIIRRHLPRRRHPATLNRCTRGKPRTIAWHITCRLQSLRGLRYARQRFCLSLLASWNLHRQRFCVPRRFPPGLGRSPIKPKLPRILRQWRMYICPFFKQPLSRRFRLRSNRTRRNSLGRRFLWTARGCTKWRYTKIRRGPFRPRSCQRIRLLERQVGRFHRDLRFVGAVGGRRQGSALSLAIRRTIAHRKSRRM